MDECPAGTARLDALGTYLTATHRLRAEVTGDGLRVSDPIRKSCCAEHIKAILVVCRAREDEGDALWLFTNWGEALAPADDFPGAAVRIKGILAETIGELAREATP